MPGSITLGSPRRSALISGLIHAVTIALVLFVSMSKHSPIAKLIPVGDTAVYLPPTRLHLQGGGQHSPLPVPKGQPPKAPPRVFAMPVMIARDTPPPLEMPAAVLAMSSFETGRANGRRLAALETDHALRRPAGLRHLVTLGFA